MIRIVCLDQIIESRSSNAIEVRYLFIFSSRRDSTGNVKPKDEVTDCRDRNNNVYNICNTQFALTC